MESGGGRGFVFFFLKCKKNMFVMLMGFSREYKTDDSGDGGELLKHFP